MDTLPLGSSSDINFLLSFSLFLDDLITTFYYYTLLFNSLGWAKSNVDLIQFSRKLLSVFGNFNEKITSVVIINKINKDTCIPLYVLNYLLIVN